MKTLLSRAAWMLSMRGAIAILFGVLALLWPNVSLLVLIVLFAVYALFGGAVAVVTALSNWRGNDQRWLILVLGLIGVGVGIVTVMHPDLTTLVLALVIAINAIANGALDIAIAIGLRKSQRNEWMLIPLGLLSIGFGLILFLYPQAGALALVGAIGLYAILIGLLTLGMAARLRSRARSEVLVNRRILPDRRRHTDVHP